MNKWVVQHELDDEPTYIVNKDDENQFVEFSSEIPWQIRFALANELCGNLNRILPKRNA